MPSVSRVLVIGGGIAGMSAAISLTRAGCEVILVEKDPDWRSSGAGLTLNAPSLRAFGELGVLDQIKAFGHCHPASRIYDVNGELVYDPMQNEMAPGIPSSAGILRPVLHRILSEATLRAGVAVRLNVVVEDLTDNGYAVVARFSDGSTDAYDVVVGADGLMSSTRRLIFADAPEPLANGQGCWRAVFPRMPEIDRGSVFIGRDHRAGLNPVSEREMYLFLLQDVPDNRWMPPEQWPALLAAEMREFGGPLGTLRETLDENARISYRPLENLLLPEPWYRGRVLLIGDAAHATTPHLAYGAGLAVEDGLVLGELVERCRTVDDTLDSFMKRRFERCRLVVDGSRHLGELEMRRAPADEHRRAFASVAEAVWQPI
jgi:2-polyprenyl-6-methoxyphenol hydroxylase-like FAD-dependent oxidoreductase